MIMAKHTESEAEPWSKARVRIAAELAIPGRPDLTIEALPNCAVRVTHKPSGKVSTFGRALSYSVNRDIAVNKLPRLSPFKWRKREHVKQMEDGSTELLRTEIIDADGATVIHDVSADKHASLIAAAPEMLTALKELREAIDDGLCNGGTPGFDAGRLDRATEAAKAAVAKAEAA